jgi:hypothetical protein
MIHSTSFSCSAQRTTPLDLTTFLNLLGNTVGIVSAEADQLLSLVGGPSLVTTPPAGLSDTTPVSYSGSTVWDGYVNQPAAGIVHVSQPQTTFKVLGTESSRTSTRE